MTSPSRTSASAPVPKVVTRRPGAGRHREHQRVVGVEHRDAVVGQRLDQLALGYGDLLLRPELTEVRAADVEHQRRRRAARSRRARRCARRRGRPSRAPGSRVDSSTRSTVSGSPSSLLKEPRGRHRRAGVGQHLREHVLGAGLALGARDRQHRQGSGRPATSHEDLPGPGPAAPAARRRRRPWARRSDASRGRPLRRPPPRPPRASCPSTRSPTNATKSPPGSGLRVSRNAGPVTTASSPSRCAADDVGDLGEPERDHGRSPGDLLAQRRRGRRRRGPRRRPPARPRVPCPRPGRCRRRVPARTAYAIASRRSPTSTTSAGASSGTPARIAARIAPGSSVRGLSSVTTSRSAEPGRDLAHQRSLAAVAVAARADHDDQPSGGQRPQRLQRGGAPRRACARSRRSPASPGRRRPAPAGREPRHRRRCRRRRLPASSPASPVAAIAQSALATLKSPASGTPAGKRSPSGPSTANVAPSGARATSTARQSASLPNAEKVRSGIDGLVEQPPAVGVVEVDQPAARPLRGEQRRLRREVVLDVRVEVEVVTAQVGERGDVEHHAVDPAHHERVARDLHRAGGDAVLAHHREQRVQVGCLRRGQRGLHVGARDPGADRADHRRRRAGPLEPGLGEPGGRGLALGAGHGDQREVLGGVAVDPGGQVAEDGARPLHHEGRAAPADSAAPSASVSTATAPAATASAAYAAPCARAPGSAAYRSPGHDPLRAQAEPGDRHAVGTLGSRDAEPRRDLVEPGADRVPRAGPAQVGRRSDTPATLSKSPLDRQVGRLGAGRGHAVAGQQVGHDLAERRAADRATAAAVAAGSGSRRRP